MKSIRNLTLAVALALGMATFTPSTTAQQSGSGEKPIKGKVTSVDKSSQTIVIDGRTFQVLPTTRMTITDQQAGNPSRPE